MSQMDPKAFYEGYLRDSLEGNMFGLTKLAEAVAKTGLRGYAVLDMSEGQMDDNPKQCLFTHVFFIYRDSIKPEEMHDGRYLYRIANCIQDLLPWIEGNARHRCRVTSDHTIQVQRVNGTCGTERRLHQSYWNIPVLGKPEVNGMEMITAVGEPLFDPEETAAHKTWCMRAVHVSGGRRYWDQGPS